MNHTSEIHTEALTPNKAAFGDRAKRKLIKIKDIIRVGADPVDGFCERKRRQ
jgi:hypothetical protein